MKKNHRLKRFFGQQILNLLFRTGCNRALLHLHLQNVPVDCLVVDTFTGFLPAAQSLQNCLNSVTSRALTTIASISGGLNCYSLNLISNNQRGAGNLYLTNMTNPNMRRVLWPKVPTCILAEHIAGPTLCGHNVH